MQRCNPNLFITTFFREYPKILILLSLATKPNRGLWKYLSTWMISNAPSKDEVSQSEWGMKSILEH